MMIILVVGLELVNVICGYASHVGLEDRVKKEFWDELDSVVITILENKRSSLVEISMTTSV